MWCPFEKKRKALLKATSRTDDGARIFSLLPRAGEKYREQIRLGLEGDEIASLMNCPTRT
jgi:hypothetical protein